MTMVKRGVHLNDPVEYLMKRKLEQEVQTFKKKYWPLAYYYRMADISYTDISSRTIHKVDSSYSG